jgi:hypothetical protein
MIRRSASSMSSGLAPLRVEAGVGDILRGLDQPAQAGALATTCGVGADIRGARRVLGELGEVGVTAGGFQFSAQLQLVGEGDHVNGLRGLGQVA